MKNPEQVRQEKIYKLMEEITVMLINTIDVESEQ